MNLLVVILEGLWGTFFWKVAMCANAHCVFQLPGYPRPRKVSIGLSCLAAGDHALLLVKLNTTYNAGYTLNVYLCAEFDMGVPVISDSFLWMCEGMPGVETAGPVAAQAASSPQPSGPPPLVAL